jgi:MFS family permease
VSDAWRTATTYFYERFRAVSSGMLETAGSTFLLLIAVRGFEAGPTAKALVAGGGSAGLLLTPLVVSAVKAGGWRTTRAAAVMALGGSGALVLMTVLPWLPVFVAGSVLAMAAAAAAVPLLTQVYQENYPEARRGAFFSKTVMIRIGVAALFSELAGRLLSAHFRFFPILLLAFAGAFVFAAFCLARIPSHPLAGGDGTHPFRALRFVKEDRLFRHTLVAWMLMGFANLMMLPMRVEFLANPRYGLNMTPSQIALLVGVVPNVARLVLSPVWGWLFDRMNFFLLRVALNAGFALGILAFFTSQDLNGLLLGAVVFGIANAGGDVAWSLWVTKFAPPARVADYMSVHTFFTGVRGVLAPLVAFHMASRFTVGQMGWCCASLISVASLMLVPEIRWARTARPGAALVEEVSE